MADPEPCGALLFRLFFFQAEDGIRYKLVTGVQTCALPIWRPSGMTGDALVYDPLGRLLTHQLASGVQRLYSYTAFDRTVQESDLAPVLDGRGRIVLTERSLPGGGREVVEARYDVAGRITEMWLAGGAVRRTFRYDTLGRLTATT